MFGKIIKWADDRINPIVVKELRQSTNSRVLSVVVIAFLAIQLFCLYTQVFWNDATSFDHRQTIFPIVLLILTASCIYGIIPTISNRFFNELNGDSIDLIYTTVLSPFAVIMGKTLSAMGLIVLLYSLCTPFIFISYLFPGIDIVTILLALWYSFCIITAISQLMIVVATVQTSKIMRSIIMLGYFGGAAIFTIMMSNILFSPFRGSFSIVSASFYTPLIFTVFWFLGVVFLYLLAVAAVTPKHANRAFWPRVCGAMLWGIGLITLVLFHIFGSRTDTKGMIRVGTVLALILFLGFLTVATGERAEYGKRLRRSIPQNRFLRFLAFPFFSGEVNGFVYSLIFLALTGLTLAVFSNYYNFIYRDKWLMIVAGLAGYFVWYSLLSLQIKRMFKKRFPNINSFLVTLFMIIIVTLIPMFVAWGVNQGTYMRESEMAPYLILSFGIVLIRDFASVGVITSLVLSTLTLFILLPFVCRRISEFKPFEPGKAPVTVPVVDLAEKEFTGAESNE